MRHALISATFASFCIFCATSAPGAPPAPTPVTVTLDTEHIGSPIAEDFLGLSFEMRAIYPDTAGHHLFDPDNQTLIAWFKTLGIRSLRLGGASAESGAPNTDDLDRFFAFARAAGVKVIYTLPIDNFGEGVRVARYVNQHYAGDLDCYSIGNEAPNPAQFRGVPPPAVSAHLSKISAYLAGLNADDVAPSAMICGCSTSPVGVQWTDQFAAALGPSGHVKFVGQHLFPCGSGMQLQNDALGREALLDPQIEGTYGVFYAAVVPGATKQNLGYRLDETNSFFHGGRHNVTDTHASALWALDYLRWWALHRAGGVNIHTGANAQQTIFRGPSWYGVFWSNPSGGYDAKPIAYAIKAFDLARHGRVVLTTIDSPEEPTINITAYGVVSDEATGALYATVINREHGEKAHVATVTIAAPAEFVHAERMELGVSGNDIAALSGTTLGGAEITSDGAWDGKWTPVNGAIVEVAPATALVVKLTK